MNHGTRSRYLTGCSCDECLAAHRAYCRSLRRKHLAERVLVGGQLVHPRAPHGTSTGYNFWGCRCRNCTGTSSKYGEGLRRRRACERVLVGGRLVHPQAPHGSASSYSNWLCRCWDCTEAWREACAARRVRLRGNDRVGRP